MSSTAILESVVSGLVSSYAVSEASPAPARLAQSSKARVPRKLREAKEDPPSVPKGPLMARIPITLDAPAFLVAIRQAGKTTRINDNGIQVPTFDPKKEKEDQIQAIGGFVGYDLRGSHGSQLDSAMRRAAFQIKFPNAGKEAPSQVRNILTGFVAGMPDGTKRAILDLQGRIRVSEETIATLEKEAEEAVNSTIKETKLALATVESERIQHMRRDLKQITG